MKRFVVVFSVATVVIAVYLLGNTSSPGPASVLAALVYSAVLVAPLVAIWYAIDVRRRQR